MGQLEEYLKKQEWDSDKHNLLLTTSVLFYNRLITFNNEKIYLSIKLLKHQLIFSLKEIC